jgi:hypothetical protein
MKPRFEVKEVFTHKKRLCVVLLMRWQENWARTLWDGAIGGQDYCNGYVQVLEKNKGKHYDDFADKIKTDELTFSGDLDNIEQQQVPKGTWFLGFDSAHAWNDMQPESKTFESVKQRTMKLADEMVRRRI